MLNKTQKSEIVQGLADRFKRQKIAIFSDFSGVSVAKSQVLRRLLKKENAEYKVAKKTLFDRALGEMGAGAATKNMKGEIGVAFGYGDQVAPAKILAKFAKEIETFKIIGALLDGKLLSDKQVMALARLPSREILLAQVAAAFAAPLRGLASVLQGNIRNLAVVLNKIKEDKSK
ncbi:MAG: 50S ribosomal protein L10 [Candidatus Sungiibacteriota bacterium]